MPSNSRWSFQKVRITAVDLSLTSLGYARRKTKELKIANIDYAQADLMELGTIGRTFDVVDASGVLHHLADPFAGWRLLLGLLRPGGVMRVALYSELARRDIVAGARMDRRARRRRRRRRRSAGSAMSCRRRQLCSRLQKINDFYSVSECRDLLFHVQEHRLTLPAIAAFLAEQNLTLLGFMLTPAAREAYRRRFPDDPTMTNLDHWHRVRDRPSRHVSRHVPVLDREAGLKPAQRAASLPSSAPTRAITSSH